MAETSPPPAQRRALKARWVFPVSGDPIPDAAVTIQGGRIAAVGKPPPGVPVEDLGNVAILPGLVNSHVHLEFSDLTAPLGRPGMSVVDWIGEVIAFRRSFARNAQGAVGRGLEESLRCGTTTLGEIAQPNWSSEPLVEAGLRAVVFLELIAPTPDRVEAAMDSALRHLDSAGLSGDLHPGLSPHAPYSVHPALLRRVVDLAREKGVRTVFRSSDRAKDELDPRNAARGRKNSSDPFFPPVAFHLAESDAELELLRTGSGTLGDLLRDLGITGTLAFWLGRPLDYLVELAPAHRALVIHGNYLDDEEIAFVARHPETMSIVYCPRTHAYFGHKTYPLETMLSAGATVALGTDSRASSPDLSVLAEMRQAANRHPSVPLSTVLRMGTLNGARALGLDAEVGSLEPGKSADLAIVALPGRDAPDPHELLFHSDEPVVATWVRGGARGEGREARDELA